MSEKYTELKQKEACDDGNKPTMPPYYHEEDAIPMKELLLLRRLIFVLLRGKKMILIITFVVLLVTVFGLIIVPQLQLNTKGTVQTAVKLYFTGIDVGQTPSGANYDINEMKSAEILQNAINDTDIDGSNMSQETLKACISFQAVIPESKAEILQAIGTITDANAKIAALKELSNTKTYPDTYIVKLNLSNGLRIDKEEGQELLNNIVLEYKKHLIEEYGDNQTLSDVVGKSVDLSKYDYIEAANILDEQLAQMESFVKNNMEKVDTNTIENANVDSDTKTSSEVAGMNPQDFSEALSSIRSVDMEGIFAMIGTYNLTKDSTKVVAVYNQLAADKAAKETQYEKEAAAVKAAMANSSKNKATIVLGDVGSNPVSLNSENDQYNDFVLQYIEAEKSAVKARADAKYYRAEAERFSRVAVSNNQQSPEVKAVAASISLLNNKLAYWTQVINNVTEEYNAQITYQKYLEQLLPARFYANTATGHSLKFIIGLGVLIGLFLGALSVLLKAGIKEGFFDVKNK